MDRLGEDDPREIGGYRLLGRLGAGGMGRVYLARTPGHRRVALKVVHPHLAGEEGFRSRFAREAQAARLVSGAFTASVLDADPEAEVPWLATEYLPGPTLRQAVTAGGPLRGKELRGLAAALAEALAGIHEAGLVHRDLKPGNVVLAADGPRVIDFGIAKALDTVEATHTARGFGTLAYVSPEQAMGGSATAPSDVFSLGSVLVFAATGEPPFGTAPQAAVIHRIVDREPDLGRVEEGLREPLAALLAKDPAQRPTARASVRSLGGAPELVRWEQGGPVERMVADSERETGLLAEPSQERSALDTGVGVSGDGASADRSAGEEGSAGRGRRRRTVLLGGGALAVAASVAVAATVTLGDAPESDATEPEYPEFTLSVLEPVEANPLDVAFEEEVVRGISLSGEVFAWVPPEEMEPVHFVSLPSALQVHTFGNNRSRETPRRLAVADSPWYWGTVYEDGSSLVNRSADNDPALSSGIDDEGYTAVALDSGGHRPVVGTGDGTFGPSFGGDGPQYVHRNPNGLRVPTEVDAVAVDREGEYVASAADLGDDNNIRVVSLEEDDPSAGQNLYVSPEQVREAEALPTGEGPDGTPGGSGRVSDTDEGVTAVAVGPDGGAVVFAIGTAVFRWNTGDDTAEPLPRATGDGAVDSVAISPDGTLAAASGPEGAVNVWHAPSGQRVATMAKPEGPAPLAFTEDGGALRTVDAENVFTEWDVSDLL
ncbi:WD40 repeat domain-containing serine/threonine protein kinase [Nocardiopsis ganjiahuensis]|uniref:WD40 repeat domain-containing serine/threonine protein kinase n=1 Tax=Nocardiopsis ganjiahuensis TaxID=239984 RepID=UPI000347828A|nr:serine/threonine-protein kinase [Nocardiopsis ganjiahuensis]